MTGFQGTDQTCTKNIAGGFSGEEEVKPEIEAIAQQHSEVQPFYDFFTRSTRGLIR